MSAPFPDRPAATGPGRLLIFGAGALGSLYGAQMAAQLEVILIARPAHVSAIQQAGLRLKIGAGPRTGAPSGMDGNRLLALAARPDLPPLLPGDRIGVFCKSGDTVAAGRAIAAQLAAMPDAAAGTVEIWSFQNGIDNRALLQREVDAALPGRPRPTVQAAIANHGATLNAPGEVTDYGGDYRFPDTPAGRALRDLTAAAGVVTHLVTDIDRELWRKLALNCVVNPLTFLLQRRNRFILTPELAGLRLAIMREVEAVAAQEGVRLEADDLLRHMETAMAPSMNYSSMYQDWLRYALRRATDSQARLRTEIGELTGAVVARAKRHDIPVPVNETLLRLVQFHETGFGS